MDSKTTKTQQKQAAKHTANTKTANASRGKQASAAGGSKAKPAGQQAAGVVTINGKAFELDIFELETAQRFETAVEQVYVKAEAVKQAAEGEMKISDAIRAQCETVFDFFDTLFGKGAARKVFGARVNLIQCIDAFEDAIRQIEGQKKAIETRLKKSAGAGSGRTGRAKA